jgi:hypothetical protein
MLANRMRPRTRVPLIDGSTTLRGGPVVVDCSTSADGLEAAVAVPAGKQRHGRKSEMAAGAGISPVL